MPELPEVETVKRQLQRTLIGKTIKEVLVYLDKIVKVGPEKIPSKKVGTPRASKEFAALLKGERVTAVERRAKYLIIELGKGANAKYLVVHLRMSGQMIVVPKKDLKNSFKLSLAKTALAQTLPSKHSHVEFVFKDGSKLFYNDTRQFGHLRAVDQSGLQKVFKDQELGPEPLELSLNDFKRIAEERGQKRVKDFLLNQGAIAGIGNIYADEALFRAGVRPDRKVSSLNETELKKLLAEIKRVLNEAIKAGGSSLEYFLKINGDAGKFVASHKVYGRAGKPCLKCDRPLVSAKIASRTSVFCEFCQK